MAESKRRGQLGEIAVIADVLRRGYRVSLPLGEDCPYDLVVERRGRLERVQVKYVESDGRVVQVRCRSTNGWRTRKYLASEIDWIATYDETTKEVFYVASAQFAEGRSIIHLRLAPTANGQVQGVRWARDHQAW